MATHAVLSPSGAERWMSCPGSVILSDGVTDPGSEYADEGTAAHFLAEQCLTTGDHPATYIGETIVVWSHPESESSGCDWAHALGDATELTARNFKVDSDMAANVNSYVGYVRDIVTATGGTLLVEQSLDISFLTEEEGAKGTTDAVVLAGDELIVVDLKYGQGKKVEAGHNKQLQIYALAALEAFEMLGDFDRIRLVIHQPRICGPVEWDCSADELRAFGEEVKKAAQAVDAARRCHGDDLQAFESAYLAPSTEACRWCRVGASCPALGDFVQQTIGADFDDLTGIEDQKEMLHEDVDPVTLATKMNACELIETWIKAVRGAVERELFEGKHVPGYKLVEGKLGNRQWINAEDAEKLLKAMKIKEVDMYDRSLISPTSAEKLFKAGTIGPRQWPKVEAEITRKKGQPSVAPESDPRPALAIGAPEDDFEVVEDRPDLI